MTSDPARRDALRVLHAYKIFRPDVEGGVPSVIGTLTRPPSGESHLVLAARGFGRSRKYVWDSVEVEAVASLGTLLSMPLAPGFIPAFLRTSRASSVVIHHAPFPLNDLALLLGLPSSIALIVYWHADIVTHSWLKPVMLPIVRRVLSRADRIIVSGEAMIKSSGLLGSYAEKCEVVPYGIDIDYWRTLHVDDAARAAELKQKTARHIVAVGRLVPYKGFDVLIRAMPEVNARLTLVGAGSREEQLKHLAAKLGLANRIRFAGPLPRDEIKKLFYSAHVLAFPSTTEAEAYGLVQAEAMATGLPIVNTSLTTAVPWVARHNQEALTVPPNDAPALADALNKILDQPDLAKRLGSAAAARALSEFSQDRFRARIGTIYRKAVESRTRPRPST